MLERVERTRRRTAVLPRVEHGGVGVARQQDVAGDPRDLVVVRSGRRVPVGLAFPVAEARARPGAQRAAALALHAVVGSALVVDVPGAVAAALVDVAEDGVRAGDHQAAQPVSKPEVTTSLKSPVHWAVQRSRTGLAGGSVTVMVGW